MVINYGSRLNPVFGLRDSLWESSQSQEEGLARQMSVAAMYDKRAMSSGGQHPSYKPDILSPTRKRAIIAGQMAAQSDKYRPSAGVAAAADGSGHTAGGAQAATAGQPQKITMFGRGGPNPAPEGLSPTEEQSWDHLNMSVWDYTQKYGGG